MQRGLDDTLVGDLEDTKTFPALRLPETPQDLALFDQNLELQDRLTRVLEELRRVLDENDKLTQENHKLAEMAAARMGALLVIIEAAGHLIERAANPVIASEAVFDELLREVDDLWRRRQ